MQIFIYLFILFFCILIRDTYSHTPGKVYNNDTGDVACDHYHLFRKDIQLLSDIGVHAYRFSLSWSRILPNGTLGGGINQAGVNFYNSLIDTLLEYNIQPMVTLYHWDLPQALQDEFGGWESRKLVQHFADYANLSFQMFGDRVKTWITFNEPWCVAVLGNEMGIHAPGYKHNQGHLVYKVAHNILLAHAHAVDFYRKE